MQSIVSIKIDIQNKISKSEALILSIYILTFINTIFILMIRYKYKIDQPNRPPPWWSMHRGYMRDDQKNR